MTILCTHPGRFGDILWAMPTARALAEETDEPVDLLLSAKYGSIAPLLQQQPYLNTVSVDPAWQIEETAPITPREPPPSLIVNTSYSRVVHLGYEGWPTPTLPEDVARRAGVRIDLERPWITSRPFDDALHDPYPVVAGWSDEYFELKLGITRLVSCSYSLFPVIAGEDSRWAVESVQDVWITDWIAAASFVASAKVFLGCCSALHVLAVALGKPCAIMEPNPHRWNDVFWPLGKTGRVKLVLGNDGQPTFDARHVADALRAALEAQ